MLKVYFVLSCAGALLGAPAASHAYGALAVGPTGYGYVWNGKTKQQAGRVAIEECEEFSKNCKVVETFNNEWASFARSPAVGRVPARTGFATGKTKKEAQKRALDACRKAGGRRCDTLFVVQDKR
jgi:hypothetical protein